MDTLKNRLDLVKGAAKEKVEKVKHNKDLGNKKLILYQQTG